MLVGTETHRRGWEASPNKQQTNPMFAKVCHRRGEREFLNNGATPLPGTDQWGGKNNTDQRASPSHAALGRVRAIRRAFVCARSTLVTRDGGSKCCCCCCCCCCVWLGGRTSRLIGVGGEEDPSGIYYVSMPGTTRECSVRRSACESSHVRPHLFVLQFGCYFARVSACFAN